MGLPARPTVVVRLPRVLYSGERVTLEVDVTCEKHIKVEFIDVVIRGRQGWMTSNGKSSSGIHRDVPSLGKRVMGEGALDTGRHVFPLTFELPPETAPSHELRPAYARLQIDVHVSIPWWPDGRYRFTAPVSIPPPPQVARTPRSYREPFEAKGNEPRIELSLASTTVTAGETVVGSIALFHMPDRAHDVKVSIVPRMRMHGGWRPFDVTGAGYHATIRLPEGTSGQASPFRVALPAEITPTFKSITHEVSWLLQVRTGSFLRNLEMAVPLEIIDVRARDTLPALTLAPRVADERVTLAFQRFAATSGMTVITDETDAYPGELPGLVRDIEDAHIRIGYAYRGTEGTYLVSRVTYRSLGIGLSVTPSAGLRDLLSTDIEIGTSRWDRAHHVDAREDGQAIPFLRHAVQCTPDGFVGSTVRWTDDEFVAERSIATVEERDLTNIANALESLAGAIASGRSLIPPPHGIEIDSTQWNQLAARLNGNFSPGDLSIVGTLDGVPAKIGLVFDDKHQPTGMRVQVGTAELATEASLPDRVTELLANLRGELPDIELHNGIAGVTIPLRAGTDAAIVRDTARALRSVIAALVETSGPYR